MSHYDCKVCGTYGCTDCGPVRSKAARQVSEKAEVNKEDSNCNECGDIYCPGCEHADKVQLFPGRRYETTLTENPELTRYAMKCLAKVHALHSPENQKYFPQTPEEAEAWEPHAWVINAMVDAFKYGKSEGLK